MNLPETLAAAKGILFDMDGVLIDSEPVHEEAIVALSGELGDPIRDKVLLFSFKGAPEKNMAARFLDIYPGTTLTIEDIIRRKVEIFAGLFGSVRLVEGAKEFVQASHASGRKHGLTTSATLHTQQQAFSTFGFGLYFDTIITGEDIQRGKPDPEPYLLTAERLGLDPAECIVIEDSINGVLSGKAAGCAVVALTTTFPREDLAAAGADFIVDSFAELSP
ncbi:MAG: HAD family phosphatase [Verrucomicrobiaceae bacterium]|nr:MAG: HAD family phosphatase [Verrucomicrobiaceae bacterium]